MPSIDKTSWKLLLEVSRSDRGLLPFTIHRRLSVTAGQLALVTRQLVEQRLITVDEADQRLLLTHAGVQLLQAGRVVSGERSVENLPTEGISPGSEWIWRPKLAINSPYVPRRSLL